MPCTSEHEVTIRPYSAEDLPLLGLLVGDPVMMVHLGGPESPEAIVSRHERYLAPSDAPLGLFTVVAEVPVGWVGHWERSRRSIPRAAV